MDETLDGWLDREIDFAENERGMLRSYRGDTTAIDARLYCLRETRRKLAELWGEPALATGPEREG